MSGFSESWLALREPHDVRARNADVLDAVAAAFSRHNAVSVVDLACGTGSTFRAVSIALPERQHWRLVDNDLSLLARAKPASSSAHVVVSPQPVDLVHDLELALDGQVDLVTTSAFLDLVSAEWLERLIVEVAARKLPLYAAINYDGRSVCEPADRFDDAILTAVNRHQLTDKGFGPSLGPAAAGDAIAQLRRLDYAVTQGKSDWVLDPRDVEMQIEIVSGWAAAARELDELSLPDIADWLARRRELIDAGRSSIRVGHVDFFAQPAASR
jgi:hypothetical protein